MNFCCIYVIESKNDDEDDDEDEDSGGRRRTVQGSASGVGGNPGAGYSGQEGTRQLQCMAMKCVETSMYGNEMCGNFNVWQ